MVGSSTHDHFLLIDTGSPDTSYMRATIADDEEVHNPDFVRSAGNRYELVKVRIALLGVAGKAPGWRDCHFLFFF